MYLEVMSLALFDAMFGSKARARVIRFFLLNTEGEYSVLDVTAKIMLPQSRCGSGSQ
jgi:hypothetical protein